MGFIKIDRRFIEWEWKDNPNMVALWIEILLQANYIDYKWHGETFEKGSFPTSIDKLSKATGLTPMQTRVCLNRLKSTNEITSIATSKGTKIIVNNWAKYQCNDENITNDITNTITSEQQTDNKQITTLKEIKNIRNKEIKNIYGEYGHVKLTKVEYEKLVNEYSLDMARGLIQFLDEYIEMKGYKANSHYLCIRKWVVDAYKRQGTPKLVEHGEKYEMDV